MRVRLQGAAPLGGNFDDDIVDRRLRTIIHPEMNLENRKWKVITGELGSLT
jgi:hypothetical protein